MKYVHVFNFVTIVVFVAACQGQTKKDTPKNKIATDHPKLIKTIGSGNVQSILQDKAGNLWFGTTGNGLYKYDGKSFTRFLAADGLNSNTVYSLLEDKDGKIWIGTEAGLCLYDGKSFTQIHIPLPKKLPPNNNPTYRNLHWVYSMVQTKTDKIWFVTIDGVYTYDGKSFTLFDVPEAANSFLTSNDKVERIFEDMAGN